VASTRTADASAESLQADLNADFSNDGFADLAVGAPGESIGSIVNAGAVNVLYGSATGSTGTGSQFFTQNTAGVGSTAEAGDTFGNALGVGDFNNDGFADLAIGAAGESSSRHEVGAVNVLYGSAAGLTGTGSQFFTQDSPGVGSTAEAGDFFGSMLGVGDFDNDGFADLGVGVQGESIGSIVNAGAVNVLYGSATGLSGTGSQFFTQDSPGWAARPRRATSSVARWASATSTTTVSRTWPLACRSSPSAASSTPVRSTCSPVAPRG
jgi:FG-GAP repeat